MINPIPKPHTFRSKEYLDFIRSQPCCNCGHHGPSDPHHVRFDGNAGWGMKPPDTCTVPLCNDGPEFQCHDLTQRYKQGGAELEFMLKTMVRLLTEYIENMVKKQSPTKTT